MAPNFRFPRARTFLHIISLPTATEFITLTLAINKVTGFYGILALFTGYSLNWLQLSHYIYSLAILGFVIYLSPAIREPATNRRSVLKNVALAWVYVLDAVINSAYTTAFSMGWFVLLSQHLDDSTDKSSGSKIPGQSTMEDTAGFTNPEVPNANSVDIIATPAPGVLSGQSAVAVPNTGGASSDLGNTLFQSSSIASLTVLGMLWLIRLYFCIIMLSHARAVLRRYVATTSATSAGYTQPQASDATMAEHPFQGAGNEGGLSGRLGRAMLYLPSNRYWLGKDESEDEWVRATSGRFESGRNSAGLKIKVPGEKPGVGERERRARSGTGPPLPPPNMKGDLPQ